MSKGVNVKINSDTKQAESGIKKVEAQINRLTKSVKAAGQSVAPFNNLFSACKNTFSTVTSAIKQAKAVMDDCTEAWKVQAKAEAALSQAAQNNPYLNKASVQHLKDYASELQSISDVGDEASIKIMAFFTIRGIGSVLPNASEICECTAITHVRKRASAGRTEDEIKKIMSASIDISASGIMSVEQAAHSLNATYNGMAGALGRQVGEIKGLTAEQLRIR